MSTFQLIEHGNVIAVEAKQSGTLVQEIPPAVYSIHVHKGQVYLERTGDSLPTPDRIYGKEVPFLVDEIGFSWNDDESNDNLGVLLTGTKGSGKTMTANHIANKLIGKNGLPVFRICDQIDRPVLEFVSKIAGKAGFIFEEFSKVYDDEQQESLLTFFSDETKERRLSIIVDNDSEDISDYYFNRPGRFMFSRNFGDITKSELEDVIANSDLSPYAAEIFTMYTENTHVSLDICITVVNHLSKRAARMADLNHAELIEYISNSLGTLNVPEIKSKARALQIELSEEHLRDNSICKVTVCSKTNSVTTHDEQGEQTKYPLDDKRTDLPFKLIDTVTTEEFGDTRVRYRVKTDHMALHYTSHDAFNIDVAPDVNDSALLDLNISADSDDPEASLKYHIVAGTPMFKTV